MSLPGVLPINRHAFESLFRSASVSTGRNAPQTLQIVENQNKLDRFRLTLKGSLIVQPGE